MNQVLLPDQPVKCPPMRPGLLNRTLMDETSLATDTCLPTGIDGVSQLAELAIDLRSTWKHDGDTIWRGLDEELWEATNNPWVVLQTISRCRLRDKLADPDFRGTLDALTEARREYLGEKTWFQKEHADSVLTCAAYFSMEFMLSEALPIYSGGLGNVAGDQLKAASDLGVPVVGVGLLYQQGYFRQSIAADGTQLEYYPFNDPAQLPIAPLRDEDGEWVRIKLAMPDGPLWLRAWQVQAGRVRLVLLDSNDGANLPAHRGITSELYGGGPEMRLKQEIVLGIGGWRLLTAMGIQPDVCHLNEGHAAFAVLERACEYMARTGQSFESAMAITRAGNIFTTHTAVPAGFDRFAPSMIEHFLGRFAVEELGIPVEKLLAMGQDPGDPTGDFNMASLAIQGSGAVNGVSRLHGEVSRHLFASKFPRWPINEIPVGHVTNGVHMPSWDSSEADALWTEACGKDRWRDPSGALSHQMRSISDERLWQFRTSSTHSMIEYARTRLSRELAGSGASSESVEATRHLFDPNVLTLGFARRFASYKRPNLLLHDRQRLLDMLNNPERPVQLVIAGKAHPADLVGQTLIRNWIDFIRDSGGRSHVIFLSDYDMKLAQRLVQGVDVWINTPRRPWEASGTSGMKVLVNGGLNLSELDGWWAEAYQPEFGWAIGDGAEHGDDPAWDAAEANELYEVLENEVIPLFYERDERGIPTGWLAKMRNSMSSLTPQYSAIRSVRQYTQEFYLPAAQRYHERAAMDGQRGAEIVHWRDSLRQKWDSLVIGETQVATDEQGHHFSVDVFLDGVDPRAVQVQMYAASDSSQESGCHAMTIDKSCSPGISTYTYRVIVSTMRPASDYTARIVPVHPGVAIPLELNLVRWQQ
ncbi:alpha-glucan family phosphorylase [Neorhodopirellula lusitana]|uniref:alpha-glucan family phosphorylase n=1 Tax=Neorhodopirellula lusitana TaxID=445327 RepID=UPI00384B2C13